jgi:hypothetical protein
MMPLHYMRSACLGELFHCCPTRCSRGGKSCRRLAEISKRHLRESRRRGAEQHPSGRGRAKNRSAPGAQCVGALGTEPRASHMLSGCDTTTPRAQLK